MTRTTTRWAAGRRTAIKGGMAAAVAAMLPAGIAEAQMQSIPRDRTMVLIGINSRDGRWVDYELWNPYAIGANHQNGPNLIYEPLAYYSAFADKLYMWLAESYQYTPDFKQLTIKTRQGIKWSDGTPFSAEDVAYTFNTLRDLGPKVKWGIDVSQALDEATVTDPNTVVLKFKIPSPRFFFFATYKYDIGIYMVPKHIFQGQDWASFKAFDLAKGWPVTTGPWKVVESSLQQKVFDRRESWWAADQKLAPMPHILRNIWLPYVGEQESAQALITNQVDFGGALQPATFPTVIRQNPKITTHAGQKPPWGYVDWWPLSLYVNNEVKPFDDKDVRWAISHYIDRKQIIDVAYLGAETVSSLPMPPYKPLLPYFDAVKDLLAKYNTLEFDPKKGDALLEAKGFKKTGQHVAGTGRQALHARNDRFRRFRSCHRPGAVADAEAARRDRQPEPAARFRQPLPEGPVRRLDLRPWRQHPRAIRHAAPVSRPEHRGAGRACGEFQPLEKPRIRQDR